MLLALAAVTGCLVAATAAKDLRYPERGPVAFLLHVPDTWTPREGNGGSMQIFAPDGLRQYR
jgi:hypothetical protein